VARAMETALRAAGIKGHARAYAVDTVGATVTPLSGATRA
jgi:hypothetical protein